MPLGAHEGGGPVKRIVVGGLVLLTIGIVTGFVVRLLWPNQD
jgi:hypothetical protein